MNNTRRRIITFITALIGALILSVSGAAATGTHTLTVNGVDYQSYKESGSAIHWETPDTTVTSAFFAERNQTWTGNGSDNLPCPYGIHWISNENVLTISHCLPAPPTTTVPPTTVPETTVPETTVPETTVPETTVPETTVPPETTTPESTEAPTTTEAPTQTTEAPAPVTTVTVEIGTAPVPQVTVAPVPEVPQAGLPATGSNNGQIVLLGGLLVALGAGTIGAVRRKSTTK